MAGPAQTRLDLIDISERDLHVIEIGTTVLVLLILLVVYRNLITMLVAVGHDRAYPWRLRRVCCRALPSWAWVSPVRPIVLHEAIIFGAGTDYASFSSARYHD